MTKYSLLLASLFLLLASFFRINAGVEWKYQITTLNNPAPGYLKFDWKIDSAFFLCDNSGNWQYVQDYESRSLIHFKFLHNGTWICHSSNKFLVFNQYMQIIDSIPFPQHYLIDDHEVELLSNGHYLVLCQDTIRFDLSQIVENGKPNAMLYASVLVETDRTGTIYWAWNALDHLAITDVTSDIDLSQYIIDLHHINSYLEDANGNLWISIRNYDEIIKINKSTGNIIWYLGGSSSKNNQFTFINDNQDGFTGFSHQHFITLLNNGNLLLYDNGNLKETQYSRAVEYQLDQTAKTATKIWEYRAVPDIYQPVMGSVCRLSNGNTLINWGAEKITEVRNDKTISFEMTYDKEGYIYRAYRIITRMAAASNTITNTGNYQYGNSTNQIGLSLNISSLNGSGYTSCEKHFYAPQSCTYSDSSFSSILPFRWVLNYTNLSNIIATVKFNLNTINDIVNPDNIVIYHRNQEGNGVLQPLNTMFNSSTNELSATTSNFGEYVLADYSIVSPVSLSQPENNSNTISIKGYLSWNLISNATKYQVQLSDNINFSNNIINQTLNKQNSIEYQNLQYNHLYYWRVRAINSKDTTQWSDIYSFTTIHIPTVQLFFPSNDYSNVNLTDTLKWNLVNEADNYWIQVSKYSDFEENIIEQKNFNTDYIKIENLEHNTLYYWRVKGYNSNDTSDWSVIWRFSTKLPVAKLLYPVHDTINLALNGSLIWNSIIGANTYSIQVSQTPSFSSCLIDNIINDTIFNYSLLHFNNKYYWRVRANKTTDFGDWSETWCFYTFLSAPELVFPVNDQIKIDLNTKMSWNTDIDANKYNVQISLSPKFNTIFLDTLVENNVFYPVGLASSTKYYWHVKLFNDKKMSYWSDIWCFTTFYNINMVSPTLTTPKNNATTEIEVKFVWKTVDLANHYKLQVSKNENFTDLVIDENNIITNSFNYSNFEYEKQYYWRVKAFTNDDSSKWSNVWVMTTRNKLIIIQKISPINEALNIPLSGQFEWNAIDKVSNYCFQLSTNVDFSDFKYNEITNNNYFNYSELDMNKVYFWRVKYYINNDSSAWSKIWTFTTLGLNNLDAPELLSPYNNEYSVPIDGKFAWNNVDDAESYIISVSTNLYFDDIIIKQHDITNNKFDFNSLDFNHEYYWRVSAKKSDIISAWSKINKFTTELDSPMIIFPINQSTNLDFYGNVVWTPIDDAMYYNIQISIDSLFSNPIINKMGWQSNSYDYELASNTFYYLRVRAMTEHNFSRWSSVIKFKTGETSIIQDSTNKHIFNFYPNPVKQKIFIDNYNNMEYRIYTINGIQIHKGILTDNFINVKDLFSGIYFIKIDNKLIKFIKE